MRLFGDIRPPRRVQWDYLVTLDHWHWGGSDEIVWWHRTEAIMMDREAKDTRTFMIFSCLRIHLYRWFHYIKSSFSSESISALIVSLHFEVVHPMESLCSSWWTWIYRTSCFASSICISYLAACFSTGPFYQPLGHVDSESIKTKG
jgi:hypothetical protein